MLVPGSSLQSGELSQRNLFQGGCPEHQILYQSQGEGLNSYTSFPETRRLVKVADIRLLGGDESPSIQVKNPHVIIFTRNSWSWPQTPKTFYPTTGLRKIS